MSSAKDKLQAYKNGKLSERETDKLQKALFDYQLQPDGDFSKQELKEVDARIKTNLQAAIEKQQTTFNWPRLSIAASIIFAISAAAFFFFQNQQKTKPEQIASQQIKPGKNAATLTLSDGRKILLDEKGIGLLARESGTQITKNEKGEIIYTLTENQLSETGKTNSLSTTNGQTVKVILPDGSKVWLNATSEISYPSSFKNKATREISLTGEAYFEAAHDPSHPFIVTSGNQSLRVLGTKFDISAYKEDKTITTTLVEGKVQLKSSADNMTLKPGEQSQLKSAGSFSKQQVDTDAAIDWKDGYFTFDDETLESMLSKLARWYDVKVTFADQSLKSEIIFGSFSRFDDLDKLLKTIERTGKVKFTLEGKSIIVRRSK